MWIRQSFLSSPCLCPYVCVCVSRELCGDLVVSSLDTVCTVTLSNEFYLEIKFWFFVWHETTVLNKMDVKCVRKLPCKNLITKREQKKESESNDKSHMHTKVDWREIYIYIIYKLYFFNATFAIIWCNMHWDLNCSRFSPFSAIQHRCAKAPRKINAR